jgi:hypothetical protein
MTALETIQLNNRELAEQISEETLRDPHHPYRGKFVGIANGQIVAVADNLDEAIAQLERVEPDPSKCFCFEGGVDYQRTIEFWSPF